MTQSSYIMEKGFLRLNNIDSDHILSLLYSRHSKDVIVPECKNGKTWITSGLLELHVSVLCRTYSPLTTIGYEIKCNRQDFERDQKWQRYLDLCHEFYFVCPAGLIRNMDVPPHVGIIWATKARLHTKQKAKRIEPDTEKLNRLLIYILMSRSKIVANMYKANSPDDVAPENRLQSLREYVEDANARKELAYFVKGHVREIYELLEKKGWDLDSRERRVENFRYRLSKLGIEWDLGKNTFQEEIRVGKEIDLLAIKRRK